MGQCADETAREATELRSIELAPPNQLEFHNTFTYCLFVLVVAVCLFVLLNGSIEVKTFTQ